jgi:hypothetical protein
MLLMFVEKLSNICFKLVNDKGHFACSATYVAVRVCVQLAKYLLKEKGFPWKAKKKN